MPPKLTEPWSKRHKAMTKAACGGLKHSLSNSFAEPLCHDDLVNFCKELGESELVSEFTNHSLEYTPNGGSTDLKEEIAKLYGDDITSDNILVIATR